MCAAVDTEVGLRPHGKASRISSVSALFFSLMERFHLWTFQESNFLLPVFNFCEGIVILAAPLQFSVLGADRYNCRICLKGGKNLNNKQKKNGASCYEDVTRIRENVMPATHQQVIRTYTSNLSSRDLAVGITLGKWSSAVRVWGCRWSVLWFTLRVLHKFKWKVWTGSQFDDCPLGAQPAGYLTYLSGFQTSQMGRGPSVCHESLV